jgi:hypothetical protein
LAVVPGERRGAVPVPPRLQHASMGNTCRVEAGLRRGRRRRAETRERPARVLWRPPPRSLGPCGVVLTRLDSGWCVPLVVEHVPTMEGNISIQRRTEILCKPKKGKDVFREVGAEAELLRIFIKRGEESLLVLKTSWGKKSKSNLKPN